METSAKTAMNVNEIFMAIGKCILLLSQMSLPTAPTDGYFRQQLSLPTPLSSAEKFNYIHISKQENWHSFSGLAWVEDGWILIVL